MEDILVKLQVVFRMGLVLKLGQMEKSIRVYGAKGGCMVMENLCLKKMKVLRANLNMVFHGA